MANTSIVLATFPYQQIEARVPLASSVPIGSEYIASAASSTQSELAAPVGRSTIAVWIIKAREGDIWVRFGDDPVAAEGEDWLVRDGETLEVTASPGHRVAVLEA